jgi:hypothetical protein
MISQDLQEHRVLLEERKEREMSFESYYGYEIDVLPTLLNPTPQKLEKSKSSSK